MGVPDLIIEVLSPSNRDHDRLRKKAIYQKHQVPEYWIVAPDAHEVEQLVLVDGLYQTQSHSQWIRMAVPPHMAVDLQQVW